MQRLGIATLVLFLVAACSSSKDGPVIGGIYTINNGDGSFGVVKVLVVDSKLVHVMVYKNKWETRPTSVDTSTLSLGSITDKDGFGIAHLPLSRETFDKWQPVLVSQQTVSGEELDGYNEWKKDGGGHF